MRDALLGEPSGDWDLTTRARPGAVRRLFHRTVPVGIEHGTVGVLARDGRMYEVTTFRRDVETDGRHARVAFADTVAEDLGRRDFTINSLAWHPLRDEVFDPYHGREDLEGRILRTVGDPARRFSEDYLRVLRALRFSGRFHLSMDPATWEALCEATPNLPALSAERIRDELLKIFSGSERPSEALALLEASGALAVLIPEMGSVPADEWEEGVLTADFLPPTRPLLRMAAWMGSGAPANHPGVSVARVLERLRFSNAEVQAVGGLVQSLSFPLPDADDSAAVRRWLSRVTRDRAPDLLRILGARARYRRARLGEPMDPTLSLVRRSRDVLRSGAPLAVGELSVDGRALIRRGLRPGPEFGVILRRLLDRVLEDPGMDDPDLLLPLALGWANYGEDDG